MHAAHRAAVALRAAAAAPGVIQDGLAPLLEVPPRGSLRTVPRAPTPAEAASAVVLVRRALRVLARIPRGDWRTTCLYRSVAECLALRAMGMPAVLRLGVRSVPHGEAGEILAHAWVECPELGSTPDAALYNCLHPPVRVVES